MPKCVKAITLLIALLMLSSCGLISTPDLSSTESPPAEVFIPQTSSVIPNPIAPTPNNTPLPPVMSTITTPLEPTSTLTSTVLPILPTTATQPLEDIDPFHFVTSLAGLPVDSNEEVQVRALADGSVWIITDQAIMRWINQEWWVQPYNGDESLAAVDDSGKIWFLIKDSGDIATFQGDTLLPYTADSGWTNVDPFEVDWWATAPWSVYTDASGILWVPLEQDVRALNGNQWRVYTLEDMGFQTSEVEDISIVHYLTTMDTTAEVWVGECTYSGPGPMGGGGVRWFDGQIWHGDEPPIGSQCVSAVTVDNSGDIWFGVSDSVWHYTHDGQSWTEFHLPEALLSGFNFTHPRQLIVDQAGDVWVIEQMCGGASCDGQANLYRIHAGVWSLVTEADYWSSSFKQLILDRNGQGSLFWEEMFYQLDDTPLEPVTLMVAQGVDVSPDGRMWVVAGIGENINLYVREP